MKGADYAVLRFSDGAVAWRRKSGEMWQTAKSTWHYKLANANIHMHLSVETDGTAVYLTRYSAYKVNRNRSRTHIAEGLLVDLWEQFMNYARML